MLVGCDLLAAATLGAALALLFPASAGIAWTVALAVAICAPAAVLIVSFVIAGLYAGRRMKLADLGHWLGALLSEALDFNLAVLAMIAQSGRPDGAGPGPGPGGSRPLLLIHGIACNRGVWQHWIQRLQAAGFGPIRTIDLEPVFADIDAHAARVARELRTLQQQCGGARVAVVAHSMGGLVARAAFRRVGPDVVSRVVTIAAPHHGTRVARLFQWTPTKQMRPDSAWLKSLNAAQEGRPAAFLTSIYSLEDNLVIPARSASLHGANLIELRGLGHLGLLASARVKDYAVAALSGA